MREAQADAAGDYCLDDWLALQSVALPSELKFSLPLMGAKLDVRFMNVTCHSFRLVEALGSRLLSVTPEGQGTSVMLTADNIALTCEGDFAYAGPMGITGIADAKAHTTTASLNLSLELRSPDSREPRFPTELSVGQCSSHVRFEYDVQSTELSYLLPGLGGTLQHIANGHVDDFLCGDGIRSLSETIGQRLRRVKGVLHEYMAVPPPARPKVDPSWLPFQDVPLVQALRDLQELHFQRPSASERVLLNASAGGDVCLLGNTSYCFFGRRCLAGDAATEGPGGQAGSAYDTCMFDAAAGASPGWRLDLHSVGLSMGGASFTLQSPANGTLVSDYAAGNTSLAVAVALLAGSSSCLLELNIAVNDAAAAAVVVAGIDRSGFGELPEYHEVVPGCVRPQVRRLDLVDATAAAPSGGLSLRAALPPSPLGGVLADLFNEAAAGILAHDGALLAALGGYLRKDVTQLVSARLHNWSHPGLDDPLHDRTTCPEPKGYETHGGREVPLVDEGLAHHFLQLALGVSFLAVVLGAPAGKLTAALRAAAVGRAQRCFVARWAGRDGGLLPGSLCASPAVPRSVACALPLCIVACLFFMLTSNFILMAETVVNLESHVAYDSSPPQSVTVWQVMAYSPAYSVRSLLRSKGFHALGYFLFIFSIVVPYAKMLAFLGTWIAPSWLLTTKTRGRLLYVLDQAGKVALVDIFILMWISASLATTVRLAEQPVDPPERSFFLGSWTAEDSSSVVATLRTTYKLGYLAFVIATIGSLVLGHVCFYFHNRAEAEARRAEEDQVELQEIPGPRRPMLPEQLSARELPLLKGRARCALGAALLLTLAMHVVGCMLQAFTVTLSTPFGIVSETSHSLYGFSKALPGFSAEPNAFLTRFAQVSYILFVLVTSQAHLLLLTVWWWRAPSAKRLSRLGTLSHTLFAWSALDVALAAMVVSMLEIDASNWVKLSKTQASMVQDFYGVVFPPGERFLTVSVVFGNGTFLLFLATALHSCLGRVATWQLIEHAQSGACQTPLLTVGPGSVRDCFGEDPAAHGRILLDVLAGVNAD